MDLGSLMKKAKQMQADMEKMQSELEETVYSGTSNGIEIRINGKYEAQEVNIPEELMDDREMLQDMVLIAFNNAVAAANEDRDAKMAETTSGLNIPGF